MSAAKAAPDRAARTPPAMHDAPRGRTASSRAGRRRTHCASISSKPYSSWWQSTVIFFPCSSWVLKRLLCGFRPSPPPSRREKAADREMSFSDLPRPPPRRHEKSPNAPNRPEGSGPFPPPARASAPPQTIDSLWRGRAGARFSSAVSVGRSPARDNGVEHQIALPQAAHQPRARPKDAGPHPSRRRRKRARPRSSASAAIAGRYSGSAAQAAVVCPAASAATEKPARPRPPASAPVSCAPENTQPPHPCISGSNADEELEHRRGERGCVKPVRRRHGRERACRNPYSALALDDRQRQIADLSEPPRPAGRRAAPAPGELN